MDIVGSSWIYLDRSDWHRARERSNDWQWEVRILNSKGQSGHLMNQRLDTFCHRGYRSANENKNSEFINLEGRLERIITCSGRITEITGLYS